MAMVRAVLAALALVALLPGAAHAASVDAVTMFSDGDYIGGGVQRVYTPANGEISVSGSTSYLSVGVSGGAYGDSYSLDFAAPYGQTLGPGVYDKAQRAPFREAGRPGIDIGGDGRGCNEVEGRFEVKEFSVGAEGYLQRLWIVYEHHCEGGTAGLFGEVRLGVPGQGGPLATTPSIVRWPVLDQGGAGAAVPVTVIATGPAQLGTATVAGAHAADFPKRLDECSGRTLAAGGACEVWVRFVPTAPGTRQATLRIPEAGGSVHDIRLQGFAYGGRTRVIMRSDPGDYIGQGQNWSYTTANATIAADGSRQFVGFGVDGANGDWWYADFAAASGDILVPGETYEATRYPFNGSGPGMSVDGEGRGCNELSGHFTVTDARFEPDGRLRSVGIDFEQHCEHMTPALRGTFEFRAGDTTPLPPWMVSGPGSTGPNVNLTNPLAPATPGAASHAPSGGGGGTAGEQQQSAAGAEQPAPCTGAAATGRLVRGSRRADRLKGTSAAERILAGAGRDRITARGGADCVNAGAGRDLLRGGAGTDALWGGGGADRLWGGGAADVLRGGSGGDRLAGGGGRDRLFGGGGDDMLAGGAGRDRLVCGGGRRDVARGVIQGERVKGCERVTRARSR